MYCTLHLGKVGGFEKQSGSHNSVCLFAVL